MAYAHENGGDKMRIKDGPFSVLCAILFILSEIVLFPMIQLTSADVSAFSSYLAIVLVALFAFFVCRCRGAEHFIRVGILFTLVADYFLVLADDRQLEGVLAFIVVQLAYFLYLVLSEENRGVRNANIFTRVALSGVLVVAAIIVLGEDVDALSIASVVYYANLVSNIVFAFKLGRTERIFAIGLVLFAMCDLCIGLEVLFSSYLDSDAFSFFYGSNFNLPWVFYQPSQVLIALGLFSKKRKQF